MTGRLQSECPAGINRNSRPISSECAIKPITDDEEYDVDAVCEIKESKERTSQSSLKKRLGYELELYAQSKSMSPPTEGSRCWTLEYAESAQFHMDTLPALPDGAVVIRNFERRGFDAQWADTAIAITDRNWPNFEDITNDWPHSNPKGFAAWFVARMDAVYQRMRESVAFAARANVEDIPAYRVRTPLQQTIQILKRHRDTMFASDEQKEDKPASIILTTLSAHSYNQETTIGHALYSILERMDSFIEDRHGTKWIPNPTDPAENFADRWQEHPSRQEAFYRWLEQARADFSEALDSVSRDEAVFALKERVGERTAQRLDQATTSQDGQVGQFVRRNIVDRLRPAHREQPPWPLEHKGSVRIDKATYKPKGWRPLPFGSNGQALPKNASLRFEAKTTIPRPFQVYWQVINTGDEAARVDGLRGGFDEDQIEHGKLKKNESTLYSGTHSIECFIVKDGMLAARSGQYIVNIQ